MILRFMILEFQRDEIQISTNKGVLFKNVIEHHFLKEWDEKVIPAKFDKQKYADLKIEVLSILAFFMVVEEDSVKIEEVKAKEIIDDFLKDGRTDYVNMRDEILRQLFKSHILIKAGTQLSFWHKSFRDYFAALKLIKKFQRMPKEFMHQYATERWEGAILFSVGIMDEPSDFVDRLIQPFWRNLLKYRSQVMFRLSLAAKCIGANNRVSIETQQIIIEQLKTIIQIWESKEKPDSLKSWVFSLYYTHRGAFQALGETKSEKAADYLGERLETNKDGQRAVCALRNMPLTEKICNSLVYAALRHEDGVVRRYATEILDENMPQEIESKLLQVLNDRQEKNEVRVHALDVLRGNHSDNFNRLSMRKYSDEVICAIIKAALEDTGHLRSSAAWTLAVYGGKDKEERIINSLVHALLNNHSADIRTNAAYALVGHGSPRVRKALIKALDDESP
ncbi:MAG: HEAT repeat domain-containing protein, partial [Candidatus Heimdallarchaeota archaeon]|nr:HEAT repeat domain-containing protein [Candidatus Heimdallarchaeota archaeon]